MEIWKYLNFYIFKSLHLSGGLAQLARAPALQAGGQRFESVILHNKTIIDILIQAKLHKRLKSSKLDTYYKYLS